MSKYLKELEERIKELENEDEKEGGSDEWTHRQIENTKRRQAAI